jgi:hypothetical protein
MSQHELDAQGTAWVDTPVLCRSLSISRSTLGRWRRRELLRHGHHWVKKNPRRPAPICSGTSRAVPLC